MADLKTPVDFRSTLFGELGENRTADGHSNVSDASTFANPISLGTSSEKWRILSLH